MKKTFYSNGKLLLTAEYLVLDGATAFALPTKFGQNLVIEAGDQHQIYWKSYDKDGTIWFEDYILFSEIIKPKTKEITSIKSTLVAILHQAFLVKPEFITTAMGYKVTTQLSFPKQWGLGTSSTLINNIAQWLQIDAFELLKTSFGGSGYDIACAQQNNPLLYHLENGKSIVEEVAFNPDFKNQLYFVYLNKKQNSKSAIAKYQDNKTSNLESYIRETNSLTNTIIQSENVSEFSSAVDRHEELVSELLGTKTVKEALFCDFEGHIKSLGAWGGDFVLAVCKNNPKMYFASKGYETVLSYNEMIL
jgi:mevalonate kinase